MKKFYEVAGHTFSFELPDTSPLGDHLGQYSPFLSEAVDEPLFELSLVDDIAVPEDLTTVYDQAPEPGESEIKMSSFSEGWYVTMALYSGESVCCRMVCDKDFRKARTAVRGSLQTKLFGVNNSLMLLFALSTATQDTLEMHASMVSWGGRAYLFLGKSGTGKSTHSHLWLENIPGTELMNDDNPIIRVSSDGTVTAYGSPWSGKTPCYRNVSAPIGAIVRIRRAGFDRITRYGTVEAYASIYSSCSGLKSDKKMSDGIHSTLEKIVTSVPCYVLDCLPDEQAARVCHAEVCANE